MHLLVKTIALLLIAISIFACKKPTIDNETEFFPITNPVAMGDRTIGMHVTIPESSDYETEFLRSKELGITAFPFTFFWEFLEPDSGVYNFEPLKTLDIFFPYYNSKVSLCVTPIKYIDKGLPADLMNKSFNDTNVINRFKTLLDSIHTYLSNTELSGLIIGNEIDLYFNQHPSEWSEYKDFYHAVCPYAQQLWNNQVDVGTEVCRETLCTHYPVQLQEINQVSDVIAISYYPIDASFHGKEMSEIEDDFDEILQLYPTEKIYIEETGYPTGQHNLSNELKQSQYINFLFSYWDKHPTQIIYIGMLWLTEISDNVVNTFVEEYGMSSSTELDAFKDYLKTTAFREYDNMGKNKHGYLQLIEEIKAR